MTIHEKLLIVQSKLKVPKSQYNSFGKYNYRSCEDILEAAKPYLKEMELLLTLTDSVEGVGNRVYITATADLIDTKTGECYSVKASAREDEEKAGMAGSQITGAASSYARKYALNGLFCLDDTKDADATNTHGKGENSKPTTAPTNTGYIPTCTVCGAKITDAEHDFSVKKYNRPLCRACQKKERVNA